MSSHNQTIQITLILFIMIILTSCSTMPGSSDKAFTEHELFSMYEEVSITLPTDWKTDTDYKSPSLLKAIPDDKSKILRIDRKNRADYASDTSLQDYVATYEKSIRLTHESMNAKEYEIDKGNMEINEHQAYYKEANIDNGRSVFGNIYVIFESEQHFNIVSYSSKSPLNSSDTKLFEKAVQSVRIMNDTPANADIMSSSPYLSPHGNGGMFSPFEIRLPSNWKVNKQKINPESVLEVSNGANQDYMFIFRNPKSEFDSQTKLKDFYEPLLDSLAESDHTDSLPKPTAVTINGLKGVQIEYYTEVNNRKIGQLDTFLETPDHFIEIYFYTPESRFERVKEDYINYTKTYKELDIK